MADLRIVGTAAAIIGAAVSLALLLIAGKSTPPLLLVMFIGWVLLPFVVLTAAILTKRLSDPLRAFRSATSILVSIVSVFVYFYFTFYPPSTTPARVWLLTPGCSLIIIAAVSIYLRFRKPAD